MKPNLVILNIYQLGYHTDTYNYCRYLKSDFNITYVSFNQGLDVIEIEGIKSVSVPQIRGFKNLIKGYVSLAKIVKEVKPDIVFLVYVRFLSIVKLYVPKTRFIFDIRTGSLFDNRLKRFSWNFLLWFESLWFKNITVISNGLRKDLRLPARKCHLLPLGGNMFDFKKEYESVNLLYIGTLDQRNIHYTIEGLALFNKKYPEIKIHYDIVGYGNRDPEELVRSTIINNNLEHLVNFHGRVPYDHIEGYLMKSNVGVVFLPATSYYDHQPTTKLFEFLLAGIPVLATKTSENKSIVKPVNGILIDDSPGGFATGLIEISTIFKTFNKELIRNSVSDFSWEHIVNQKLKPLLYKLIHD